jgi:hypothetical protein
MGFMSNAYLKAAPRAPDYSTSLIVLVKDRLLGDGYSEPRLQYQRNFWIRELHISTDSDWEFKTRYRPPFVRELVRSMNFKGTLEYDPIDFVERLVEVLRQHRPAWLHK